MRDHALADAVGDAGCCHPSRLYGVALVTNAEVGHKTSRVDMPRNGGICSYHADALCHVIDAMQKHARQVEKYASMM